MLLYSCSIADLGRSIIQMAKLTKFSFKGIIATAFAPFKGGSAEVLNLSVIPEYARHFQANGFKAVLVNGTYGEGMNMTSDERMQVAKAWSDAVKQTGQELIVQVGGTNLQDVKKLAAHAQSINASALLCLPELYYKPRTVDDLIEFLTEVGSSAPNVPLFYYHSPDATGVNINMTEFFKKVDGKIPNLAGIKFANTKIDDCTSALEAAGDQYRIIVADNNILPVSVAIGIDTFMPTIINVAPQLVNSIYKSAVAGDFATAQAYQNKLSNVHSKLATIDKNVMPVMKAVTRHLLLPKIDIGITRRPLKNYDAAVQKAQLVAAIMSELK